MASVINGNEADFKEKVLNSDLPVLVDFWAPWCRYCTKLTPVFDELANDLSGKVKFIKVNVDDNRDIAQEYNVMSLPTMLLIKNGEQVEKLMGFMPKETIVSKITPFL